jgi:hypothetical protein
MSYLEIIDRVLEKQRKEQAAPQKADISLLRLSELARRNIAIKIYSDILGCEFWLCSNADMVAQVKQDDPGAAIYTVDEMRKLIRLNPDRESLTGIHNIKSVFENSRLIEG